MYTKITAANEHKKARILWPFVWCIAKCSWSLFVFIVYTHGSSIYGICFSLWKNLLFTMKNRFETKSKDSISHWKSFDRFKKLTKKVWLIDRHWTVKLISHSYFVWDCEFVCMCVCLSVCVCVKMRKLIRKTKKDQKKTNKCFYMKK